MHNIGGLLRLPDTNKTNLSVLYIATNALSHVLNTCVLPGFAIHQCSWRGKKIRGTNKLLYGESDWWCKKQGNKVQYVTARFGRISYNYNCPTFANRLLHLQIQDFWL